MTIEIRKAADRGETQIGWLDSRHCFSFGSYVDQTNTGHGLLGVSNDDRVAPATGFGTHGHSDMEIITWVLSGEVEHSDTLGNHGIISPGLAQRMTAGRGIRHSEQNPSPDVEAHFVQMWVPPDIVGLEPGYEQQDVTELLNAGGLVAIAGGTGSGAVIHINQRDAVMSVGRLKPGETVSLPVAVQVNSMATTPSSRVMRYDSPTKQHRRSRPVPRAQNSLCGPRPKPASISGATRR